MVLWKEKRLTISFATFTTGRSGFEGAPGAERKQTNSGEKGLLLQEKQTFLEGGEM